MRDEYDLTKLVPTGRKCPRPGRRIVLAPTDGVEAWSAGVRKVLEALGHPEALVTDESRFSDFLVTDEVMAEVSRTLGVTAGADDYIVNVAKSLKE